MGLQTNFKAQAGISAGWVGLSLFFLDMVYSRIQHLRAVGDLVSPWRWVQVVFWIGMLIFWIYRTWFCWTRYRMDKKVV
jgi:hypothetical protein